VLWAGDYRQKAPAAACDPKKGRQAPVGGSPAWKLPKIARDRDQSRGSQACSSRALWGPFCRPDLVALHRYCKDEQGSGKEIRRFDLTYAPAK
jgi:hypothetical protein